jgi:uncharacterized protein (DUF934 family)
MSVVLHISEGVIARVTVLDAGEQLPVALSAARTGEAHLLVEPQDDVLAHAALVAQAERISVNFPKFTDGRGYSSAVLLRSRLAFRGALRATGDVLIDQVLYLVRVGFDEIALRADQKVADVQRALSIVDVDYREQYKTVTVNQKSALARITKEYAV